ncbi:MAG: cytochrome c oxidase assembly protein [Gemmatimonadaceae bacterium]
MWDALGNYSLLLLLHPVAQVGWTGWSVHWSTVVGIAALGALYFWRATRAPFPGTPTGLQKLLFASGLFAMFASLNGPVHDLSDYFLFSAHMVQHLLITMLVPPLLIAGTPGWMLRPLLRNRRVFNVARFVTRPVMCFVIFNLTIVVWHLPIFYNAAMADHNIHIAEHLMFMSTAVLMWWPFMSPLPELPRLAYPGQMLYCFLTTIPMSIVAVYISLADHILYPAYAWAPRVWGIMPMVDQQLGGLIMWIPGSSIFYGIMSVVFFKWVARGEDNLAAAQVDWVMPSQAEPLM